MPENDNLCTEAENKILSFLRNYRTCFTHFHFHNVCHKMRDHGSQLQWHSVGRIFFGKKSFLILMFAGWYFHGFKMTLLPFPDGMNQIYILRC